MRFADSNATVVRRGARGWGGRCCARGACTPSGLRLYSRGGCITRRRDFSLFLNLGFEHGDMCAAGIDSRQWTGLWVEGFCSKNLRKLR